MPELPPAWCEHGPGHHDGGVPSHASAPEGSRAWLLIEFGGLWAREAVSTPLPEGLGKLAVAADELGIRVQLIRRPARGARAGSGAGGASEASDASGAGGASRAGDASGSGSADGVAGAGGAGGAGDAGGRVFAAWTAGPEPWLADVTSAVAGGTGVVAGGTGAAGGGLDLEALAEGEPPASGTAVERMYLVCVHGRRNRCCAQFGGPLARALAPDYPAELWETTHVGGHKFAANLVLLPHGHYYGPCDAATARAAIGAYERGAVLPVRYRGRAGQPAAAQQAEYASLAAP